VNRAILAGSVIVGIAVMMSISIIAPAFAASYWKDVFICGEHQNIEPVPPLGGTYYEVNENGDELTDECEEGIVRADCTSKSRAEGHWEFKDFSPYDGKQQPDEHTKCHKSNFWIDAIPFVVPVV